MFSIKRIIATVALLFALTATTACDSMSGLIEDPASAPVTGIENGPITAKPTIGESDGSDYSRTRDFGTAWKDTDSNGCNTRDDILARDLTNVKRKSDGCRVASGTLNDPYTGTVIEYTRGGKGAPQIDHIYPLSLAARHGASTWTQGKREQFANDPANLIAAQAKANTTKSDKGPSQWMPSNAAYRCTYAKKFIDVAVKYSLTVTQADYDTAVRACR